METAKHRHAANTKRIIFPLLACVFFGLLTFVIFYNNWSPNTWLIGWDNLLPEFDFPLNISRSLTAVWQEYQSTGLLGGMGHASALPRELFLWMLSIAFPTHMLRYIWTGLMLWFGMMGAYILVKTILSTTHEHQSQSTIQFSAIIAGIYYLTNLATIQIFRAPFEAFITHHAALPWLLWGVYSILLTPSRKNLFVLATLSFFLSTQGYIPTLFLVSMIHITLLCFISWLTTPHKKQVFMRIILIFIVVITTNAYWLAPSAFFTLTKSSVTVNAKINQMATEEVFLRNKKFGTITDTLTLRNFWFDNAEFDPKTGSIEPMMNRWNQQYEAFLPSMIRILIAYTIVFGCLYALTHKKTAVWGVLGFMSFAMLAIDAEPFASSMNWLRGHIPLLSQFFRFPFTKWGSSIALFYAILLAFSISFFLHTLSTKKKFILTSIVTMLLLFTIYPAFTGDFISNRFIIPFPKEYRELFQYMRLKPDGRIAIFPQQTYWDWKYYAWGDLGSGFLWYGIKQPILDRAFDVWSSTSENYYWEISRAIYSKNSKQIADVLRKYDVRYIFVDDHIVSASHNRSLAVDEINEMLSGMQNIALARTFGKMKVYEVSTQSSQSFVSLIDELPTVSPIYSWSDFDSAYDKLGSYISSSDDTLQTNTYMYPFRSFFTKRSVSERSFTIQESDTTITLLSADESTSAGILKNASLAFDSTTTTDISASNVLQCELLKQGSTTAKNHSEDGARFVRITNMNQRGCLSFGIPSVSHKTGYLVAVKSRYIAGKPLLFSIVDMTSKHTEFEAFLPAISTWKTTYFILPPLAPDGLGYNPYISNDSIGRQQSINDIESVKLYTIPYDEIVRMNRIDNSTNNGTDIPTNSDASCTNISVNHPNPAYYEVRMRQGINASERQTLVLSQSFDDGWIALTRTKSFPFVKQVGKHVLVNNWENGWTDLPSDTSTIYLFFWPQLLEFIGLLLLPIPFLFIFLPASSEGRRPASPAGG